ncbi:MAG: hypothetical protein FWE58_00890 [Methanobrevibacter sp.]|nr:hypothetical protein [Methanobrevibacter sp.]
MNYRKMLILMLIAIFLVISINAVSAKDITIGTTTSGGLKEAIANTNINDRILLNDGVYTGDNNRNITISKSLTVEGKGNNVIIDAQRKCRIFIIRNNVTLINLKIINGVSPSYGDGGGIYVESKYGILNVNKCTFKNNYASMRGGAIYNAGRLNINNSYFEDNSASFYSSAIYNNVTSTVWDSGMVTVGIVRVNNSYFVNDKVNNTGQFSIYNSIFKDSNFIRGTKYITKQNVITNPCFTLNVKTIFYNKIATLKVQFYSQQDGQSFKNIDVLFNINNNGNVFTKTVKTDNNGNAILKYHVKKHGKINIKISSFNYFSESYTYNVELGSYKFVKIVKKNGKYYKRYGNFFEGLHKAEYKDVLAKKGTIVKKIRTKSLFSDNRKGKVYKIPRQKVLVVGKNSKVNWTIKKMKKELLYIYKDFTMPKILYKTYYRGGREIISYGLFAGPLGSGCYIYDHGGEFVKTNKKLTQNGDWFKFKKKPRKFRVYFSAYAFS